MERKIELKLGGNALSFYSEKLHKFCIRRDITPKEVELEEREHAQYAWVRTTPPTYKETMILDSDKIHEEVWDKADSELFVIFQEIDIYDDTLEKVFEEIETESSFWSIDTGSSPLSEADTSWLLGEDLVFEYQKQREKLWIAKDRIESAKQKGIAEAYLEKVEESKRRPSIPYRESIAESSPNPF